MVGGADGMVGGAGGMVGGAVGMVLIDGADGMVGGAVSARVATNPQSRNVASYIRSEVYQLQLYSV